MKYSYEFKKEYVQLYREGKWPNTPEDSKEKNFHDSIRTWFKLEELHGPEILKYGNNINLTPDEKLEIVSKVLAGNSIKSIAIEYAINDGQLYWWVNKYKNYGYNGLVNKKRSPWEKNVTLRNSRLKRSDCQRTQRKGIQTKISFNSYWYAKINILFWNK